MLDLVIDSFNCKYPDLRPKNRNEQNQQSFDSMQCNHDTNLEVSPEHHPLHYLITPRSLLKDIR